MFDNHYKFEIPSHHKSIIKVIGVGGGGSNAVNHMYNQGIKDVEFVVCNTDAQALKNSPVPYRLQLGSNLTEGLGAGANPEKGKNAALESKEDIRELLSDSTKMVFITAGMGGGTGTGAAPVIAKVAKELDILTVGIVTAPFSFEGKRKITQAEQGINELKQYCDTVLVISNDKLREIYGNLPVSRAFAEADNILTTAAKGIAEIITVPGYVNVDFEDVKTVMKDSGAAVMGSAQTEGEQRAFRAAEEAISSPLLNNKNILGAQKILLSIISGDAAELQMDELSEITEYIQEKAGDNAEVIFGHGIDPALGESIRVTVIATGFENMPLSQDPKKKVIDLESNRPVRMFQEPEIMAKPIEKPKMPFSEPKINVEPPTPKEEPLPNRVIFNLENSFDIIEDQPKFQEPVQSNNSQDRELEYKRNLLNDQARDRVNKLRSLSSNFASRSDDFKERLDTPAYLRKKVVLQNVQASSENNMSRYNLNDDNQILGNNRFLHDNVD
jgi:cell division protein FtsZ